MLAASAASAFPTAKISAKCSAFPAPPEAMTGTFDCFGNRSRQFNGKTVARSVGVHRSQKNLART
jgi:hypothetical protein